MKERKKYYLLPSDVFAVFCEKYCKGEVEVQELPYNGSRKIACVEIFEEKFYISVEHEMSRAKFFISESKPEEMSNFEHPIVSLHAGFYTDDKMYGIWWIEPGDSYSGLGRLLTLLNWAYRSAISKLQLYSILFGVVSELIGSQQYETTTAVVPEYKLPSFILSTVK